MREIRLYGSEGGGAARSPYPYQSGFRLALRLAGMTHNERGSRPLDGDAAGEELNTTLNLELEN